MKIVTYNVNGLKPRVAQHGSLLKLLKSLDADIICFQETKLSRRDLSVDLTTAEGYEAFISCTRTSSKGRCSYSGVATFCRVNSAFESDEVTLPLAAEEGFTGTLEPSRKGSILTIDILNDMPIVVEGENVTTEDLVKVDSEGRCIITDHGHFVLFNLYGPRAEDDDEERIRFKLVFFKVLQRRWEFLMNEGKRVFVVGDLNIAPSVIDSCDAQPGFEGNKFRTWLRSMLQESGPFVDVFRAKHPDRKEVYTCFSQRIGGEEFNYGSRIDHILISGPCMHQTYDSECHSFCKCHVAECDIMVHFRRGFSDNVPKWSGGRAAKLEGSDHIPVYVIVDDLPRLPVHNTPPSAVRYYPEVRGLQQRIVSFLVTGETSNSPQHQVSKVMGPENGIILHETEKHTFKVKSERVEKIPQSQTTPKKKARHYTCSQLTLGSFFQKSKLLPTTGICMSDAHEIASRSPSKTGVTEDELPLFTEVANYRKTEDDACKVEASTVNPLVEDVGDMEKCFSSQEEKCSSVLLEWHQIRQKMKTSIPLCKGHCEPCISRSVKKKGPNIGRQFYVCARAKGPASNPEANCDHFEWAGSKPRKAQR